MQLRDMPESTHAFLNETRFGTLVTPEEPWPLAVPVWYNWTGTEIEFFSRRSRPKNTKLVADPTASFVVASDVTEPVYWVAIDGKATVHDTGGPELMRELFPRYYPLDSPANVAMFAEWNEVAATFQRITISAERVRHFTG